jgi:hypothetical protein
LAAITQNESRKLGVKFMTSCQSQRSSSRRLKNHWDWFWNKLLQLNAGSPFICSFGPADFVEDKLASRMFSSRWDHLLWIVWHVKLERCVVSVHLAWNLCKASNWHATLCKIAIYAKWDPCCSLVSWWSRSDNFIKMALRALCGEDDLDT